MRKYPDSVSCSEARVILTLRRYYLPEEIAEHIDYVTPAVKHQIYKREGVKRLRKRNELYYPQPAEFNIAPAVSIDVKSVPKNCSHTNVNADCIRAMYGLPDINVNKKVDPSNALGNCGQTLNYVDL